MKSYQLKKGLGMCSVSQASQHPKFRLVTTARFSENNIAGFFGQRLDNDVKDSF
jgi:hypothetical protein